uniref:Uncharacterized protein n=1 Tax=Paraburkholderia sprentiae WSM5005 TaxID=754502 RepID=A0A1I9YUP4_9BURK
MAADVPATIQRELAKTAAEFGANRQRPKVRHLETVRLTNGHRKRGRYLFCSPTPLLKEMWDRTLLRAR